jgi:ABC-2 type transport system permease protein
MRRSVVTLVARREINERVQQRAFRIATALMLLLVVGLVFISKIGGDSQSATIGVAGPGAADLARLAQPRAEAAGLELKIRSYPSPQAARSAIEDESLGTALIVQAGRQRLLVGSQASRTAVLLLQTTLAEHERGGAAPPGPQIEEISPPRTGTSRGIAYLSTLLLYLVTITYGYFIAMGIAGEKASRVIEVILSAVTPNEILTGKVAGLGLLSLAQFGLLAIVGLVAASAAGVDLPSGGAEAIILAVVFSLLGFLLYACGYAVTGSLVSRQEDLQSSSMPLTLILVAAYILTQSALAAPHGTLLTALSIIPVTAPIAMPARVALVDVPLWEIVLAGALTLVTALLVLRLAAAIYRATVLRMGQRIPFREALRQAF